MTRVEPTISTLDLNIDPAAQEQARAGAAKRQFWKAMRDWSVLLLMIGVFIFGGLWLASVRGWIRLPDRMDNLGLPQLLIVGGLALVFGSQLLGTILLMSKDIVSAVAVFFIPGYFFIALKREGFYRLVVSLFVAGLIGVTAGTIMLA